MTPEETAIAIYDSLHPSIRSQLIRGSEDFRRYVALQLALRGHERELEICQTADKIREAVENELMSIALDAMERDANSVPNIPKHKV